LACGTNLLRGWSESARVARRGERGRDALVGVGDLFAVHARREEEYEGGDGDEEEGDVAVVDERVLRARGGGSAGGHLRGARGGTHDRGEDKDDVGEVGDDADEREEEGCGMCEGQLEWGEGEDEEEEGEGAHPRTCGAASGGCCGGDSGSACTVTVDQARARRS